MTLARIRPAGTAGLKAMVARRVSEGVELCRSVGKVGVGFAGIVDGPLSTFFAFAVFFGCSRAETERHMDAKCSLGDLNETRNFSPITEVTQNVHRDRKRSRGREHAERFCMRFGVRSLVSS